jgi:hypothetical protein
MEVLHLSVSKIRLNSSSNRSANYAQERRQQLEEPKQTTPEQQLQHEDKKQMKQQSL